MMVNGVEWIVADAPIPYPEAVAWMEARAAAVAAGSAPEAVWMLEHPPLYTAGTSAVATELLDPRFPVFRAGRGGRYTYHGPGQRIVYTVLDLNRRGRDVRCFVHAIEGWIIAALAHLGIAARREAGRIGIWTDDHGSEAKIAAIGIRVRKWVSLHGFAVNLDPDLDHFQGIIPCGLADFAVTSIRRLGSAADMTMLDASIMAEFGQFLDELVTTP